ncbi:hypothetical protein Taro_055047 [Colocasia esculenta]|uniref:Sulfotransferase n=1 Tax=Colocasia esculenta TaxID=4460 RepID=A0A843XSG7_COLES|nr:hypothetical protein [Colocasia esculenta]
MDFATLEIPNVVFLPPLHSLVMESAVGPIIFERFARVMGHISVQKGNSLAFHRFVYREYNQGHIKSDVLAPILSECERLSPSDQEKLYLLTAQQLVDLNASQARSNQPPLSGAEFLDLNSIHLVRDPFDTWVERYKVYVAMKRELKANQIFYPISVDQFLQHASFGTSIFYKMSLGQNEYGTFVEAQRVDTPIDGVDTGYHSLKQIHEDRVQCVDTASECVDTRPSLQKTQLPNWDNVISYNIGQPEAEEYLDESSPSVHGSRALNGCKLTCTEFSCLPEAFLLTVFTGFHWLSTDGFMPVDS